ncbi:hypothetical protein Py17XNL_001105444 [Plasmodium yoelii yoelii]|uniref:Uncharacterized protein n=1 Tax=Plasmodium yoelii yoelii TaxID=73239 RepID=A0AAE9WQI5_PLAYO|nr:hypothetical protein Py17XNL_001105444 [Plasmodium yoelii yoelii]
MGNSCKKKVRIMKNRSLSEDINNCFYFDDENNNTVNPQKVYIDLCDKRINNYKKFGKNNKNNLYLDKDKKVNRNSSIIYIDELYNILGNDEKIKLKKLDNSDVEEFLIIKKHIKYKKKKKKKKNKDCNVYNIDSYNTDKYMLRSIHSDDNNNNNRKNNKFMRNGIKKTKEKCSKGLLYYENDNKKTKKKLNLKLDDIETCCSSSNESKHDKFVKDKKYDIFEEDRIFLLKKRREEMNHINSSYINNKKNAHQTNNIYRGDNNELTILDTFKK